MINKRRIPSTLPGHVAGVVSKTGSFYDTGTKAAAFHPFAGPLSRSKVSQVALRESR